MQRSLTRVFTLLHILDEVWGHRFVSASALTSRTKSARAAVGDDGQAQQVIRTVHGKGFMFVARVTYSFPYALLKVCLSSSAGAVTDRECDGPDDRRQNRGSKYCEDGLVD